MRNLLIVFIFLIFMGLSGKSPKSVKSDSRKHFEILPVDEKSSSIKISKILTATNSVKSSNSSNSSDACSNLSNTCMQNETCFEYFYYCTVECPVGTTEISTLNSEIEAYCLLNCFWRYRKESTILKSYLNCLIDGTSLEILYEDCFTFWDTCTNSTECLATFTSCNTTECYQNNTIAEETYECYQLEEDISN